MSLGQALGKEMPPSYRQQSNQGINVMDRVDDEVAYTRTFGVD